MGKVSDFPVDALAGGSSLVSALTPRLAVVIPAYNEASTIRDIATRALREVERVIVVDDGSQDGTGAALHDLPLTVLRNRQNLGKSASLRRGMLLALEERVSAVVTLDADGQHQPEHIPRLLAVHRRDPRSIVIGARLHERQKIPRTRYLANRFANFWIAWAAGYPISDSQSGFRLYPASVLSAIDIRNNTSPGFVFESAVLIDAARAGVTSVAVGIPAIYQAGARPSHFRPVIDVLLITRMVGWKLITRGLDLRGLVRSRRSRDRSQQSHMA
jgi:glycosyltransferase involved in cell wall biosynthesis